MAGPEISDKSTKVMTQPGPTYIYYAYLAASSNTLILFEPNVRIFVMLHLPMLVLYFPYRDLPEEIPQHDETIKVLNASTLEGWPWCVSEANVSHW